MNYRDSRRLAWDTETTSTDPTEARIVTAAIVARGGGRRDRTRTWLINPGVPIPPETTAIHGIGDEQAREHGADPQAALDEIAGMLASCLRHGMPVVAFNLSYDWSVLHHELLRHGLLTMDQRLDGRTPYTLLDPLVLDKQVDKYRRGNRRLKTVASHYGVGLTDWHTADADATAALGVADALFEKYPKLREVDAEALYLAQQAWREEQQTGLQQHLRKTDPTAVCDTGWPLIPGPRRAES
ncbi:exonuclease domain-containing protein [Streptomyces sp. NPDC058045]|uniref:exonuclease domain-containing protein n=1 Tax=Streptomyces sp. NPDC058045 TaxID=3346311 RepID=UPI0036EC3D7E